MNDIEKARKKSLEIKRQRRRHIGLAVYEEDFYQTLKITAVKKLVWNEVVFVDGFTGNASEKTELEKKIASAFSQNGLISRDVVRIPVGDEFHGINYSGDHEENADRIFDALASVSKETGAGFIVNYSVQEDYLGGGVMIPLGDVHIHGELILNGSRLINDFPDPNMNRSYIALTHGLLADCSDELCSRKPLIEEIHNQPDPLSYYAQFSDDELLQKGFVYFDQAERKTCEEMLDSLNRYFHVDYTADNSAGLEKQECEGLNKDVREKIIERF